MPRRPQIPYELTLGPFHSRMAIAAGLTREQLRSSCWRRLFRNVYCLTSLKLTDEARLDALLLAVPDHAVITGRTAAWLFGAWQPRPGELVPLDCASRDHVDARIRHRDVGAKRLSLDAADIDEWRGIRVTTPECTCFRLMARSTVTEAVVTGDRFQNLGLVTAHGLRRYADERPHWPHVRKVRIAIELTHPGAASPMESRLRMVVVLEGLDEPHVNLLIVDAAGTVIARIDLAYLQPDLGLEYDGAYHFTDDQRDADDVRENGLLVCGMPILRYRAHAVYRTPQRIIADVLALRPDLRPDAPLDLAEVLANGWHPEARQTSVATSPASVSGLWTPR